MDLAQKLMEVITPESNENTELTETYINLYERISEKYGIVSLTETHRNILMWAHYSSSHKGVCVGYKSDFFNKQKKLPSNEKEPQVIYSPQRVKYDSKRFDQELCSETESTYELIMQALKTKSDEWMYEKEHRCIIPFSWADKFIIKKNNSEGIDSKLTEQIKALESISAIHLNNETADFLEYRFNKNDILSPDDYLKSHIASYTNVSMLKQIDIESIDAIYLGCQHQDESTERLIDLFSSNPQRYKHISIYKYRVNQNQFSLDLLPVINSKIIFDLADIIVNTELGELNLVHNLK